MQPKDRKEYRIIFLLVILTSIIGFFIAANRPEIEIVYPEQDTILSTEDFSININDQLLQVGSSTWDEVIKIFPQGKILGMSTIYRPDDYNCLLTFTEEENILHKMHLEDQVLSTYRGNKVGEAFSQVLTKYGENYTHVGIAGKTEDFDAIYGTDNYNSITFQIRENKVEKIILQKELS